MADPKFCIVNKAVRKLCEFISDDIRPRTGQGIRESTVAMTKYGFRLQPLIGMQSERMLQRKTINQINNSNLKF